MAFNGLTMHKSEQICQNNRYKEQLGDCWGLFVRRLDYVAGCWTTGKKVHQAFVSL